MSKMFEVLRKGFLQDWNRTLSHILRTVGQEIPLCTVT